MSRPKRSEPKVKLQNWVSAAQAAAIKAYLQGGVLPVGAGVGAEKISTATPSGTAEVSGLREQIMETHGGHEPTQEAIPVNAKEAHWKEQARLQALRADGLQAELEEERAANGRLALEIEKLLQMGGTERQSAYIAQLQAKIVALGGDKKEFDQT
jgi:hypothetical protein